MGPRYLRHFHQGRREVPNALSISDAGAARPYDTSDCFFGLRPNLGAGTRRLLTGIFVSRISETACGGNRGEYTLIKQNHLNPDSRNLSINTLKKKPLPLSSTHFSLFNLSVISKQIDQEFA